jgi:arylsulfatase A-like enzyme
MRIIYFDLDCTRPDHLGAYGYWRETSPAIDKLAQTSVVFDNCFASDTPCLPSRAALFSCRPGIANGVVSHEPPGCEFRFPPEQVLRRLEHLGRQDQIEDLERHLRTTRRQAPAHYPQFRY